MISMINLSRMIQTFGRLLSSSAFWLRNWARCGHQLGMMSSRQRCFNSIVELEKRSTHSSRKSKANFPSMVLMEIVLFDGMHRPDRREGSTDPKFSTVPGTSFERILLWIWMESGWGKSYRVRMSMIGWTMLSQSLWMNDNGRTRFVADGQGEWHFSFLDLINSKSVTNFSFHTLYL